MRAVLPGKPQAKLQAVCAGFWAGRRLIVCSGYISISDGFVFLLMRCSLQAYITGNAFVILIGHDTILQTIYDDDDSQLESIAIDEGSGKIATCSGSNIRVYKPYGQEEDALKVLTWSVPVSLARALIMIQWSLQHNFSTNGTWGGSPTTLSWGVTEELLVGDTWLSLFSTLDAPTTIWKNQLANPVKFAIFSYDSAYIASTGMYDRLVKVWRRLSFGSGDTRFDFSYLPHPATVTNIHWRRPYDVDQAMDNVLYTFCSDNVVRIWTATDPHGLQVLQLWAQFDLNESLQPRGSLLGQPSHLRFAFIIDWRDFMLATEHSVQARVSNRDREDHALTHLIEIANRSPEICIVLDEQGHMSAWGLENVGCKPRQTKNIFNIAHVDGLNLGLPSSTDDVASFVHFYNFCNRSGGGLSVLIHHFDGKIEAFESDVADLFDPTPRSNRFISQAVWTGHSASIKKIVRNISGHAVVSRTDDHEIIIWKHVQLGGKTTVLRQSIVAEQEHIRRICVLRKGKFVIYLHQGKIALWDTQSLKAQMLATCHYTSIGEPLCILILPEVIKEGSVAHVATITSKLKGIVWQIQLPQTQATAFQSSGYHDAIITEFCRFDLGEADNLAYVLPVDPAGSPPVVPGFLDTFARDIAISYTHTGTVRSWTAKLDLNAKKIDWLETCSVETGVSEPSLVSGSSIRKAALVNSTRSELTIWDVRGAQLEFTQDYEARDTIQDLDWTSTPDDQSILAVGFRYRVVLLAQMRYDYLNKGPAWAEIREISIRDLTPHPIGDSTWLSGGNLIIGAGNQLFVYNEDIDQSSQVAASLGLPPSKTAWDLFEVVTRLNGPLPVYHPQFLGQCILAGKSSLVQHVLLALYNALKYFVQGDTIDNHLNMGLEQFYTNPKVSHSGFSSWHTNFTRYYLRRHLGRRQDLLATSRMLTTILRHLRRI